MTSLKETFKEMDDWFGDVHGYIVVEVEGSDQEPHVVCSDRSPKRCAEYLLEVIGDYDPKHFGAAQDDEDEDDDDMESLLSELKEIVQTNRCDRDLWFSEHKTGLDRSYKLIHLHG